MQNSNITIYYCIWDGKNGSHDLLKRAAVHWCSCHNFMTEEDSIEDLSEKQQKNTGCLNKVSEEDAIADLSEKWRKNTGCLNKISEENHIEDKPENEEPLFQICQDDKWKKPYFTEPKGVKFSISHSGNLWMCAISDREVGLDVQKENSCKRERVARRFFHPQETEWLSGQDHRDFFRVWAAKESYVKYIGDGLVYGMEKFCVVDEQGLADEVEGMRQQHFLMKLSESGMLEECDEPGADVWAVCLTTEKEMEGSVDFLNLQRLKIV